MTRDCEDTVTQLIEENDLRWKLQTQNSEVGRCLTCQHFFYIGHSFVSFLHLITLENWPEIVWPLVRRYWWTGIFFGLFLSISAYAVVNLLTAVLVDSALVVPGGSSLMDRVETLRALDVLSKILPEPDSDSPPPPPSQAAGEGRTGTVTLSNTGTQPPQAQTSTTTPAVADGERENTSRSLSQGLDDTLVHRYTPEASGGLAGDLEQRSEPLPAGAAAETREMTREDETTDARSSSRRRTVSMKTNESPPTDSTDQECPLTGRQITWAMLSKILSLSHQPPDDRDRCSVQGKKLDLKSVKKMKTLLDRFGLDENDMRRVYDYSLFEHYPLTAETVSLCQDEHPGVPLYVLTQNMQRFKGKGSASPREILDVLSRIPSIHRHIVCLEGRMKQMETQMEANTELVRQIKNMLESQSQNGEGQKEKQKVAQAAAMNKGSSSSTNKGTNA
uniref:Ion transport domain-containing protein n=1 Tax=Chromera velia CCMP2878 TaxID=1169474 RepID=A0A0G4FJ73_9ALVE|eukprot:Cvel_17112.t1-p1 / transcript=Cvel_17112.t1 / gene=Cvel_17112 / organism=Chromera_velia_CCMP2878 / gene_product=hypothetical protein / transcript_product=hypothetical protein / location=Cvel_scaffold1349:31925-34198(+) / protein_length=446 / sequence_SO=supercontig / SO=protein_coding / is_pseudo=false